MAPGRQRILPTMRNLPCCIAIAAALATAGVAAAEEHPIVKGLTPQSVIDKSIAYHDPKGRWWASTNTVALDQPRPDGTTTRTEFTLHPGYDFDLTGSAGEETLSATIRSDECTIKKSEGSEHYAAWDCERLKLMRDYYSYLFNAPMNLLDDKGTIEPVVRSRTFMQKTVHSVRVEYGGESPVWYYFFDPETFALVGCSFSKGGLEQDGEYLDYQGEIEGDGVRLPKTRIWWTWANHRKLGIDDIASVRSAPAE